LDQKEIKLESLLVSRNLKNFGKIVPYPKLYRFGSQFTF